MHSDHPQDHQCHTIMLQRAGDERVGGGEDPLQNLLPRQTAAPLTVSFMRSSPHSSSAAFIASLIPVRVSEQNVAGSE